MAPVVHNRPLTLVFGGDVMLGRLVNEVLLKKGPAHVWGDTLPLLRDADVTLVNLECTIAEGGKPFVPPRVFHFRAHPRAAKALALAGVDFVSIANNHAMDFQGEALLETIGHLEKFEIAHGGGGKNLEGAIRPAVLEAGERKIGVIAFADHFEEYAAGVDAPGINFIEVAVDDAALAPVKNAIGKARAGGAEIVVFSIHWGPNMRPVPTPAFIDFAHAVMDAGVDIFYGHSAHIFQGIEVYKGKPILYDTGDLIDDYYVDPAARNDHQLLFLIRYEPNGALRIELIPLVIEQMQVNRARGKQFTEIEQRIRRLCKRFGTKILRSQDRLVIEAAKPLSNGGP